MGCQVNQKIVLYSSNSPRSTALMERIEKACDGEAIPTFIESIDGLSNDQHIEAIQGIIVLLDLPNIKNSAVQTIKLVKERFPQVKTLAIHIYTTKLLIEPLINAGAHGYLTYEPTVAELRKALETVSIDEVYLPAQIYR